MQSNTQESLECCCLDNVSLFEQYVDDYSRWISLGVKLYQATCSIETLKIISKMSSKYNEYLCDKKWEYFQSYKKNSNRLIQNMTY